jgi:hypothetical protein
MRSILILITVMTQLVLTEASFAQNEAYDDCKTSCASARETRNADCPSPYDSSSGGQDRDQCLKASQEAYSNCVKSCAPAQPSPPPESGSSPMGY